MTLPLARLRLVFIQNVEYRMDLASGADRATAMTRMFSVRISQNPHGRCGHAPTRPRRDSLDTNFGRRPKVAAQSAAFRAVTVGGGFSEYVSVLRKGLTKEPARTTERSSYKAGAGGASREFPALWRAEPDLCRLVRNVGQPPSEPARAISSATSTTAFMAFTS